MVAGGRKVPRALALLGAVFVTGCAGEVESSGAPETENTPPAVEEIAAGVEQSQEGKTLGAPSDPVQGEPLESEIHGSAASREEGRVREDMDPREPDEPGYPGAGLASAEPVPASPPPAGDVPRLAPRTPDPESSGPSPGRELPLVQTDPDPDPEVPLPRADPWPPAPATAPLVVPEGTEITLRLEGGLSTQTHQKGDSFVATVTDDVLAPDGMVLIPMGAQVRGTVTESSPSQGPDAPATLEIGFDGVSLEGGELPLIAEVVSMDVRRESRDSDARTAAKIAGGALAGAILGKILGKDAEDAIAGAAAGAAAGTAVAMATRSGHADIVGGTEVVIRLSRPLPLDLP